MKTIGFIGLGIMGAPMARNLLKAGYGLVVTDIDQGKVKLLVDAGAREAATAREAAKQCSTVIIMVPDGPDVEKVVYGEDGVLEGMQKDSIIIDMSSIAPPVTLAVGESIKAKGGVFIDAPVSGGEPGAIAGQLAIMAGGPQKEFDEVKPILEVMGKSVVRVGELGAGQTTKLVNQVLVALHIHAMGEAFILARKSGVDCENIFNAIKGGLAGSNVLNAKIPLVLQRNFKPGFRMRLHQKDLNNALKTAQELGLSLPVTGAVSQYLNGLVGQDKGDQDHGGLVQAIEQLNNCTIEK